MDGILLALKKYLEDGRKARRTMGMTIDDAIETLKDTNSYGTADIAKSVAIETMRKYQQIQEIIKSWKDGTIDEKDSIYAFHEILKVIEDGNAD